jgi:short-subunit dehydrogenase
MTSNQRVAVVTGSSTGNGYETSLTLARNGFLTYATMRNLNKGENIKSLTEKEKMSFQSITDESRRNVLVNKAGYGLFGAFEDLSMEEIKAQHLELCSYILLFFATI